MSATLVEVSSGATDTIDSIGDPTVEESKEVTTVIAAEPAPSTVDSPAAAPHPQRHSARLAQDSSSQPQPQSSSVSQPKPPVKPGPNKKLSTLMTEDESDLSELSELETAKPAKAVPSRPSRKSAAAPMPSLRSNSPDSSLSSSVSSSALPASSTTSTVRKNFGLAGTKKPIQYKSERKKKLIHSISGSPVQLRRSKGTVSSGLANSSATSESSLSPSPSQKRGSVTANKPSSPASPPPSPAKRRRRQSPPTTDRDDISGDEDEVALTASPKKRRRTTTARKSTGKRTLSSSPIKSTPRPVLSKSSKSAPFLHKKPLSPVKPQTEDSAWDIQKLGSLVWVLISEGGDIVSQAENAEGSQNRSKKSQWWAAKTRDVLDGPQDVVNVTLLGTSTPGGVKKRVQTIINPSVKNVLTFRSTGLLSTIRFNSHNFIMAPPGEETGSTGTGTATLEKNWQTALQNAMALDEKDNDDLPDPSFLSTHTSRSSFAARRGMGKGKAKAVESDDDTVLASQASTSVSKHPVWHPDEDISVGTLVVSLDRRGGTTYWPAKVTAINQPVDGAAEGTYSLLFCDGLKKDVPRKWLFTALDDGFATCKLGETTKGPKRPKKADSAHDGRNTRASPRPRSPSPDFTDRPHMASDDFVELSLREQIAFLRPVIHSIVNDEDERAKGRNRAFLAGGKFRADLVRQIEQGDLTEEQLTDVLEEIRRFVLRRERWAERQVDEDVDGDVIMAGSSQAKKPADSEEAKAETVGADTAPQVEESPKKEAEDETSHEWMPSNKFPRLHGPPDYESLSQSERNLYCSDVLLPEVIVHLYAWRNGLCDDLPNPSPEEKAKLYEDALNGLKEGYPDKWVEDIVQLREMLAQSQPRKGRAKTAGKKLDEEEHPLEGGTRSRRIYK